ncbi:FecR family protein [Pedobacter sp. MC2016-24]|uniref:FecR family protein n=1 Tax=Pedobacter sp. MC2016-24 TaxID=2780090 RepID=UPI001882B831|nr:FecR family protein [Pedobacter sp. MC2016-24]MBE9602314.1 FecR domain-containing protein [Pedobacter sp. MC2016-24]
MIKKDIHYLEYLIAREENQTISEAEAKLLADFMQDEYDRSEWDTQQMGAKAAVSAGIYKNIKKRNQLKKPFRIHYKHAVAATIALVIGLGVLLKPQPGIKEISIKTASKTDSVKLEDGTLVYLASHSEFKYPEHFDGTLRSVSLVKGNAFFKVAKDKKHPFIVSSGQIKTSVLGTSFHIGLDQNQASVTVITGHVKVASKTQVAFLEPNQSAVFNAGRLKKRELSNVALYSWYKKDVALNDVALGEVFTLLNFKYGVDFKAEHPEIENTRITLFLEADLPLQNILNQINYITHLKFESYGEIIKVHH